MKIIKAIKYLWKALFEFIKENKPSFILAILFIVFHQLIETKIGIYIVNPVMSIPRSGWVLDFIFVLIFVYFLNQVLRRLRIGFVFTANSFILSSFLLIIFLYYRFVNQIWIYTPSHILQAIKYVDLIGFICSMTIIGYCCGFLFSKKSLGVGHNEDGFYFDQPLGLETDDLLKRENFAKKLAQRIMNTASKESSFSMGISSEWGYGKTSFMDLIKRQIPQKDRIVFDFNPWLNHGSNSIIKDFFNSFSNAIKPYHPSIPDNIIEYAEILSNNSEFNSFMKSVEAFYSGPKTANDEYNIINEAIIKINKQIIVFIDDLDRLYKDEIIEVIKIIRNSANFANVIFIVAYEKSYLINALKDHNDLNYDKYLEKIFQIEISLPQFEDQIIKDRLLKYILPKLREEDKKVFKDLVIKENTLFSGDMFYLKILSSLRDVTRFTNSFLIVYDPLKGEIVLTDLLNIELLRINYLKVYELIFKNQQKYLIVKNFDEQKSSLVLKRAGENQDGEYIIKTYLKKNLLSLGISENRIVSVMQLIHCIFPSEDLYYLHPEEVDNKSVRNPSSFYRYSHYQLLDTDLSEIEFSNARLETIELFKEKINAWVKKGLRNKLQAKFERINYFNNREDFEKIIQVVFYLASIPSIGKNDTPGYDNTNLINKIKSEDELGYLKSGRYYNKREDFKHFILDVLSKAQFPYFFESYLMYEINKKDYKDFIISRIEMEAIH
ncbi:MAG TPA: P-loop NTPase fold protein, partial [Clostridia bacterium]|nr:P-loop NTPase fold protein [Clostridia bacterium]